MKIVCIYSGVIDYSLKLDYIFNIFKSTLEEINVEIAVFDVSKLNVNFFNGTKVPIIETIFNNMKNADGIIFATTAQRFAINGAMQSFIEHMDYNLYGDVLKNKTCISIITSIDKSEYMAYNYMHTLISNFGGTPLSMSIGKRYLDNIEVSIETTQMIERYAEDFYRGVRQKRKYFVSSPFINSSNIQDNFDKQKDFNLQNTNDLSKNQSQQLDFSSSKLESKKQVRKLTGEQVASLYQKGIDTDIYTKNNYKQLTEQVSLDNSINQDNNLYSNYSNFNSSTQQNTYEPTQASNAIQEFNSVQQDDINELTKLLSAKYKEEIQKNNSLSKYINNPNSYENATSSIGTLKQKTQSLYHYFQPQLASGIELIIQVLIDGKENFSGFFTIQNSECTYTEGVFSEPDISIISDANVWEEVLLGKSTLQKAFMLGRLKVKGNFIMISKFEQFFKIA